MRWLLVTFSIAMMAVSLGPVGCAAPSVGSFEGSRRELPDRGDDDDDDDKGKKSGDDDDDTTGGSTTSGGTKSTTPPPAAKQTLTINATGDGTGAVTSEPAGVTCSGKSCTGNFDSGTKVTLTASPEPGSIFAGWTGGGCSGATTCETTLANAATVTAQFITLAGTWTGTYSHSQTNGDCTFNNKGTLENTMAGTTTVTTAAAMAGFEIKNLNGCGLVDTRAGTAAASAATVTGNKVTGTWDIKIAGINGSLPLPFEATIVGNKMSGKWTCTGCTGTFDISKN